MEPACSYTIPSIEDNIPLECRLYCPKALLTTLPYARSAARPMRASIVAHPYAPLGGSYDDPVVLATTHSLVKQGYIVITFNFRGAADSKGRTSWSGHGEKQDFVSVIAFLLHYLDILSGERDPSEHAPKVELLLSGYSYGSLILSRLPSLTNIFKRFETATDGTSGMEIVQQAKQLASKTYDAAGRPENDLKKSNLASKVLSSHELLRLIKLRYLLISPLLPPLSHILVPTLQMPRLFGSGEPHDSLPSGFGQHPTLAIYGDQDGFTSAKKLAVWAKRLQATASAPVQGIVIEGAGHFWREPGVLRQLQDEVKMWLDST